MADSDDSETLQCILSKLERLREKIGRNKAIPHLISLLQTPLQIVDQGEAPQIENLHIDDLKKFFKDAISTIKLPKMNFNHHTDEANKEAATMLIDNLDNPEYTTDLAVLHVHHKDALVAWEELDNLANSSKATVQNYLHRSIIVHDIMGRGAGLELNFTEETRFYNLITGLVFHIKYPSSQHNLDVLNYYLAPGNYSAQFDIDILTCNQLQGGSITLQKPGQTVVVSPFSAHLCFSLEGSIVSHWQYSTVSDFETRLDNIALSRAQDATISNDLHRRSAVKYYTMNLLVDLARIWGTATEGSDYAIVGKRVEQNWNNYMSELVDLAAEAPLRNDPVFGTWMEKVATAWAQFKVTVPKYDKKPDLLVCDVRTSTCTKMWTPNDSHDSWNRLKDKLYKHFMRDHWKY